MLYLLILVKNNTYYLFEKGEGAVHQTAHPEVITTVCALKKKYGPLFLVKHFHYKLFYVFQIFILFWTKSFGLLNFYFKRMYTEP